jgi:hypothetical protein
LAITRGYTSIYFGENQLSRNLISLSLLPTAHPRSFQPSPVRASISCYRNFTLAMGRSSRFGSTPRNSNRPIKTRFRYGFTSLGLTLLRRVTRRLIMQKARGQAYLRPESLRHSPPTACRHMVSGTISLPSLGFFSPFPHGTSSLSVASEYLALGDGPPGFPRDFTCPAVLGYCFQKDQSHFSYGTITLFGCPFQEPSDMR